MKDNIVLNTYAKIALFYFVSIIIYFTYFGIITKPFPGDNITYHIPIAKTIINGSFLQPKNFSELWYQPGSTEILEALFIILRIPLNLVNVLGDIVFAFSLYKLGTLFGLGKNMAIIFATSAATIPIIAFRILDSQSVDLWIAVYFTWVLYLLQKAEYSFKSALLLGISLGLLIGSKYSGPILLVGLLIFYPKQFFNILKGFRIFIFLVPFSLFGLFWYIRNFIYTNDPFYPQSLLWFKGGTFPSLKWQLWRIVFTYPHGAKWLFDALISESKTWSFAIPGSIILLLYSLRRKLKNPELILGRKLLILGLINFTILFFLPSYTEYKTVVSNLRFSYPMFECLLLGIFLLAKHYKKETLLALFAIVTLVTFPPPAYNYPKLILFLIPFVLLEESWIRRKVKNLRIHSKE